LQGNRKYEKNLDLTQVQQTQANLLVDVAREVIDRIVAKKSHKVVVLSRQVRAVSSRAADWESLTQRQVPTNTGDDTIKWLQVDYESKASLVQAFKGVDTVLSFLAIPDPASMIRLQKNMIDAAIEAGVRRFAPSEWGRYAFHPDSIITCLTLKLQHSEGQNGNLWIQR
jgi:hypothetical protein